MLLRSSVALASLVLAWAAEDMVKRTTNPISIDMTSLGNFFYKANLSVGTPPQQLTVFVDTGSRDLVVVAKGSNLCQAGNCTLGSFDNGTSTTFADVADDLSASFEAQAGGTGSWVTDNVMFGGQEIKNMNFGLVTLAAAPDNILGLGYPDSPIFPDEPMNTTLQVFESAGLISSPSVSIRLADPPNLILGGIDTSAFVGSLTVFDIVPGKANVFDRYAVNLTSVSLNGSPLNLGSDSIRVVLDTGAADLQLPPSVANALWKRYNVQQLQGVPNFGLVQCDSLANSTDTFTVGLPGFSVDISVSNLIQPPTAELLQTFGASLSNVFPPGTCKFLVSPQTNLVELAFILGGPFIRQVYMVIDQYNQQIAFGRLSENSGSSPTIAEIPIGKNVLASISANPSAVAPSSTISSNGGHSTGTAANSKSAAYKIKLDSRLLCLVLAGIAVILA